MSCDSKNSMLFQSYYSNLFNDRWDRLYTSLLEPINTIAFIPPFYNELNDSDAQVLDKTDRDVLDNSSIGNVHFVNTVLPWCYTPVYGDNVESQRRYLSNTLIADGNGHISQLKDYTYYLDGASAFAPFCLDIRPGDRVLDLCSAPGGKSLILATKLFYKMGVNNASMLSTTELIDEMNSNALNTDKLYKGGLLVCNEFARSRYERMVDTMKKFIPDKYISSKNVQFTNFDGLDSAKFQRFGRFDKILLDAPCSSERHLIRNQLSWNQRNITINSKKQIRLLESAIELLKPMGIILYCTCALDPQENELVIYYILKSHNNIKHIPVDYCHVIQCSDDTTYEYNLYRPENRTYGCALMPDKSKFGPLYLAKLQKGAFHSLVSLLLAFVIWFIATLFKIVTSHYSFYNFSNSLLFAFTDRLQGFLLKLPSLSQRPARFSWFLQHLELVVAVSWITVLIEVYIDLMNYDSTHLDALIANSLDDIPVHNTVSIEDEMLLARALYNYSKGVSYIMNNKMRYTSYPPSLNVVHEDTDIRRSGMEPYSKITTKNGYLMESKKLRYQVDEVVYRMLIESSGRLWRTYVNACLETLSEVEINIHHLATSPFSDKNNMKINAFHKFTNYPGPLNIRSFFCNIIPQFSTQVTKHALNLLMLSILYLRGITSWLCIANMLGYDNINVKHVARDIIIQILNIHNVLSGLNRSSIPQYIQDYIRILNSDINNTLKCLSVYTETLLYSKFDTTFETYRILEHLYSNRNLIL